MAEQRDQVESLCLLIMNFVCSEKEEIKDDVQLVKQGESIS